jgi:ribosomal protein S18 acetylase RimI-like enzyme
LNHSLTYRQGSIDDLQQLKELGILSYSEFATSLTPENWDILNRNLHNEERVAQVILASKVFVCMDNERIVGKAHLMPSGNPTDIYPADWAYIRVVGVHPEYRNLGIGKKLMLHCLDAAKANGEKTLGLHTSEIMHGARHIYENMGFKVVKDIGLIFGVQYWLYRLDF